MLTHAQINERFLALDKEPAMMSTTIDGWLAWPVVKERLWLACLAATGGREARAPIRRRDALGRVLAGFGQVVRASAVGGRAPLALLYDRRVVRLPDGREVHPHLGSLAASGDATVLHYLYSWGGFGGERGGRRILLDHDIGAATAAMARVVRRSRGVARVAARLAPVVSAACPELAPEAVQVAVSDQLARFRVRMPLFRRLFRRWRVATVIVLDPDGKVAEVAAAKALGLNVIEVQHGMFSNHEPDYGWTTAHRSAAAPLPVADMVVVFGPHWRRQLLDAGYWDAAAVIQATSPVVGPYRTARAASYRLPAPGTPLRVSFATQGYVRPAALAFWRSALQAQQQGQPPAFVLRIKIHPMEIAQRGAYDALAAEFPSTCTVVAGLAETYPELLNADVATGYTSLMLLEAVGMGIPTIALRGGAAEEGLLATFDIAALAPVVEELASPAALVARLVELGEPPGLERWAARVAAASDQVFDFAGLPVEAALLQLAALRS